jgi:hypothetical protein
MGMNVSLRTFTIATAAGVVLVLAAGGLARAITEPVFKYPTPRTGYFSIHPVAMTPTAPGIGDDYSIGRTEISTNKDVCFITGVNLPHGATLKAVVVWYSSRFTPGAPTFELFANSPANGTLQTLASKGAPDNSQTRKSLNIEISTTDKIVNNAQKDYGFAACMKNGDKFYGARISYTYDNAGD